VSLTYALMLFTATMPDAMNRMMNEHFTEFQKMDYNIGFRTPVSQRAARDMEHLIAADYIEGRLEFPFELSNGSRKRTVNLVGLKRDTRFYAFRDLNDAQIELPGSGALITENLAKALHVGKGDSLLVKSYLPNRDDVSVPVKGVIRQTLGINAYMELGAMGELLLEKNVINGVYADSRDPDINEALLRAANVASVLPVSEMRAVYDRYMTMMNLSVGSMVFFSGILGFCIVYNATVVSLGEREMELASLRVLGFSKGEIFFMILRENTLIMLLGMLLGIPVGNLFAQYSSGAFTTDIYTLDMTPTAGGLVAAGAYTAVFVFLAQLATYRKIQGLDFLQALKSREA
jgi:putative ABC transport system permease protein